MRTIIVRRTLKAPIDRVFDLLADHANYHLMPGISKSTLVRKGRPGRNGVGAVREFDAGPAWFQEEITAYQRPVRLDYLITASRPPLQHQGASIRLAKTAAGTEVTWRSTFRVKAPLIGGLLTPLLARRLEKGFIALLEHIDRRLA